MPNLIDATQDQLTALARTDHRHLAALTELLTRLPPLPKSWPAGTVQNTMCAALNAADRASPDPAAA